MGYTKQIVTFDGTLNPDGTDGTNNYNIYNSGTITYSGYGNVGGIIGNLGAKGLSTLKNVYNTGSFETLDGGVGYVGNLGGIAGYIRGDLTAENVSNRSKTIIYKGQKSVGGIIGGAANEPTDLVGTASAFTLALNFKNVYNLSDIDASGITSTNVTGIGAGGLVGFAWGTADFTDSYNKGNIKYNGKGYLAGIIGYTLQQTTFTGDVYNWGNLTGTNSDATHAGGIIGYNSSNFIFRGYVNSDGDYSIYNRGNIDYAGTGNVGGIFGASKFGNFITSAAADVDIDGVYNAGYITATNAANVGGIAGMVDGTFSGTNLTNKQEGTITYSGTGNVGGILGKGTSTVTLNDSTNFADLTSSNGLNIGGLVGMAGGKLTAANNKNIGTITFGTTDTAITAGSDHHIGGLFAYVNADVDINVAENTGTIYAKGTNIAESGGVLGFATGDATIKNATNRGNIEYAGDSNLGGVTGQLEAGATLENLYNYGKLTISNFYAHSAGGVFASTKMSGNYQVTLKNAFNYGDIDFNGGSSTVAGKDYKVGGVMGYGRTTNKLSYMCLTAGADVKTAQPVLRLSKVPTDKSKTKVT